MSQLAEIKFRGDIGMLNGQSEEIRMNEVYLDGELFFKMENYDHMPPFLMSIVSDSNHWMFVSSNGGLTAGRKNAEYALFPYYTDDKLTELSEITGSKSIFRISSNNSHQTIVWEPFSERDAGKFDISRSLYKNLFGNKIVFEEKNHDLGITFRYQWNSSDKYGFIRKCQVINTSPELTTINLLDGIQNIMPHGVGSDLQGIRSNLVDAYKRNELVDAAGLGIYSLSAIIVDRAEPSEALKANVAWSAGFENPQYLLSSTQIDSFRKTGKVGHEADIKGRKGAFFISKKIAIDGYDQKEWFIIGNVNQSTSDVVSLVKEIQEEKDIITNLKGDIGKGTLAISKLTSASDGFQLTSDKRRNARHCANTLFNVMRGGIFDNNYQIDKEDFEIYLKNANREVFQEVRQSLKDLPDEFTLQALKSLELVQENQDLKRLATEYLPLKFSRRHGDPSRPWNKFSINTRSEVDGSKILDYEGNWRDIFQNWEALVHFYPDFIEGMIYKFLNASTFDGYNPYRITKGGFDWEVIDPQDPWSYIGYWGDHQIIYLLKFLEFAENHKSTLLLDLIDKETFVFANVPYKIKPYEEILKNPKETIVFDHEMDGEIRGMREEIGSDGALLYDQSGRIYKVNFFEKILVTLLAKISNFIPEGGIWMNTQRPEWNDANNALVGNGVSMVTLYYLRRFVDFWEKLISKYLAENIQVSKEVNQFFESVLFVFRFYEPSLNGKMSDYERNQILNQLGKAAAAYRHQIYNHNHSGDKVDINVNDIKVFNKLVLSNLDQTIEVNRRSDNLFHSYNLMSLDSDGISIMHLEEMLEGQVAVLSSGYLGSDESLIVLDSLKKSKLFREDQYSYLLYPNKQLPGFLEKNIIPGERIKNSKLLSKLIEEGYKNILDKDVKGLFHFNGSFHNSNDLKAALNDMMNSSYQSLIEEEYELVLEIFEEVFNHKAFTGRSGTFFGYEGLGSIYWHMVSKLLLAVQECCLRAVEEGASEEIVGRLLEHYYEINEGIGVHKSPALYGAFPIDPYSHTPMGKGAQQPGMTGQVKEDILTRIGELGVFVKNGQIRFNPCLLRKDEFLVASKSFTYFNITENFREIKLDTGSLAFTYCQVPIIYQISDHDKIVVCKDDGVQSIISNLELDIENSQEIFNRTGRVEEIRVSIKSNHLK